MYQIRRIRDKNNILTLNFPNYGVHIVMLRNITAVVVAILLFEGCSDVSLSDYDLEKCNREARVLVLIKEAYESGEPASVANDKATKLEIEFHHSDLQGDGGTLPLAYKRIIEMYVNGIYNENLDIKYFMRLGNGKCRNYKPTDWTSIALIGDGEAIAQAIRDRQAAIQAKEKAEKEAERANKPRVSASEALCAQFDLTGLVSSPCRISGIHKTVDVRLDMSSSDARKFCPTVRGLTSVKFDSGWSLRIFSPYSGDNPIATCLLN